MEIGDFVRVAEQTDWPQLPDEWHSTLANIAAVSILNQLAQSDVAQATWASASNDLERFSAQIQPRTKTEPRLIVADLPLFGGWRGRMPFATP